MSFTPCGGITQNITNNCQPRIKGFEQLGGIVNKKDIQELQLSSRGRIANFSMSNGYPIYQLRQNPKPFNGYKVEFQSDTNLYKKTIQFYFDGIGAANAKNIIDSLKDNEFMIVIERKGKLIDYFIFIGAQNGLHVTEMVEDEETGYWLITMETEEPAGEIVEFIDMEEFVNGQSVVSAQQVISNGEDIGTAWWPAGSAGAVDVWDNPLKDGVNNSDKSITVWINNSDVDYTGAGISGLNVDVAAYNTISVMVYKLIEGKVRLELQDGTSNYFVLANYNTPGAWQKLTFKIPSGIGNIQTLLVAPHFENYQTNPIPDGEAHRMWWDEIVAYFVEL